mgnify:CR=1 FL=1
MEQLPPVGENLKRLRKKASLTQQELANRANLSTSVVFQLEQGKNENTGLATLVALARVLGVVVLHT